MSIPRGGLLLRLRPMLRFRLGHLLQDVGLHTLEDLEQIHRAFDPVRAPGDLWALPQVNGRRYFDDDPFQLILPANRASRHVFVSRYLMIVFWYCVANTASGLLIVQAGAPVAVLTSNGPILT